MGGGIFGTGTGRILLNNIQCTANDRTLMSCTASSSEVNSCMHTMVAGVRCRPGIPCMTVECNV